jgi:hypothetical protein
LNFSSLQRSLLHGVENQNVVSLLGRKLVKTHLLVALTVGLLIAPDDGKERVTSCERC